jgi:hypothetical protein
MFTEAVFAFFFTIATPQKPRLCITQPLPDSQSQCNNCVNTRCVSLAPWLIGAIERGRWGSHIGWGRLCLPCVLQVCITGPLADSQEHMMGNYYGRWDTEAALTPRKAIKTYLGEWVWGMGCSKGNREYAGFQLHDRNIRVAQSMDFSSCPQFQC